MVQKSNQWQIQECGHKSTPKWKHEREKRGKGSIFEKWQPTYNVGAVNAGRDYILYNETS